MKKEELFEKDVSNEHALELKTLGFNEPCINSFEYAPGEFCNIPTYLQSFFWFKNQYGLYQAVEYDGNNNVYFAVVNSEYKGEFQTWDEAMLQCLNELINLVKTY